MASKCKLTALVLALAPEWMVPRRDIRDTNANCPAVRIKSQPLDIIPTLWRSIEVKDVAHPHSLSMSSCTHQWIFRPVRYRFLNLLGAGEVAQFDLKKIRLVYERNGKANRNSVAFHPDIRWID